MYLLYSSSKEEEVEEYFRKKYADEATVTRHFGDGGEDMTDEINRLNDIDEDNKKKIRDLNNEISNYENELKKDDI